MTIFKKMSLASFAMMAGALLALAMTTIGIPAIWIAAAFVSYAAVCMTVSVRDSIGHALGLTLPLWKVAAFSLLGIALDIWHRVSCFMNGHDKPYVANLGLHMHALVVKCGRCGRYMRPATKEETRAYMTKRVTELQVSIIAAFNPLIAAMRNTAPALESFAKSAERMRKTSTGGITDASTIIH